MDKLYHSWMLLSLLLLLPLLTTPHHDFVSHVIALAGSPSSSGVSSLSLTLSLILVLVLILISYFITALNSYSHC